MKVQSRAAKDRTKRRKIAVACDDCRARKVRCDGLQPVCGPCSKKSDHDTRCVYTGELEKKRATQTYISSLENRIKRLESPQSRERSSLSSASPHTALPSISPAATYSGTPTVDIQKAQCQNQGNAVGLGGGGVNAMMGAVEEGRLTQGFFGSSSAAGFMRQIKTAVDQRVQPSDRRSSAPDIALRSSFLSVPNDDRSSEIPNYVLPPRRTADNLMNVYWDYSFPLYPFVDSAHMKNEYRKIWHGDTLQRDEQMAMCTFNVIFALASQLADFIPPDEREASADAYFSRAKDLFQFNLWDTGSADLIQCLLLMAQYLQSTDSAHQCWIVTGLAIRNAQSLGLHLPQTITRIQSIQEKQLARKIWHGCVLMDRVISMTFGRPAMISKVSSGAVPLPARVDDEFIIPNSTAEPSQPVERPSMMTFYIKTLELYEIMNDVLLSLYKPVVDDGADDIHDFYFNTAVSEGERTIFDLDRSLALWARSLPVHLCPGSSIRSGSPIFFRQSVVLKARFLHARILLFRPTLSKYCAIRDNAGAHSLIALHDSFPHRVALQCSIICVRVAQESIELIHDNVPVDGTGGPLPAWWYNILYIYTAATVLIAGRLCSAILSEVTEASITHSWDCALEILRKYQTYSTSARRCVAALEILYEQVVSEGQPLVDHLLNHELTANISSALNDVSFGEGMNATMMEGFELLDFQDMSWLNSVPSNLI